ncbi:hypothetical protein KIW84_041963 [Lathyrus oleraceus]|uniref:Uncharacterized protein n=1 Tax=Pisum sativum TaxID=3888 RepID=A0A9D4XD27_PEA|nr:hypothetical protein KIW84_041963 [Pisum sativum]
MESPLLIQQSFVHLTLTRNSLNLNAVRERKHIFNIMENIMFIRFGGMTFYHAVFIFDTGAANVSVLAAKSLGDEVYNNFLDHAFIADRKTTIRQYFETIGTGIMEEEPPESLKTRYGG